jgi:predicted AAA+ superfamily ATPase
VRASARSESLGDPVPESLEEKLRGYLRTYYVVGGMPAAVAEWVEAKNIASLEEVQDAILRDYVDDFSKHAARDLNDLTQIWRSIPRQLSKENRRFMFGHVRKGARARDLENALEWLVSAGLAHKICRLSRPGAPLSAYSDESMFKLYFSDVGPLRRLSGVAPGFMFDASDRYSHFKGAMAENHVLNELPVLGKAPYYRRSDGVAEVDFVADFGMKAVPIEVKAEEGSKSKSLSRYVSLYGPECAVRASMGGAGKNGALSVPLWLVWRIGDFVGGDGSFGEAP